MMNELANKIVREYNEDRPDFGKIADLGKELADYILDNKIELRVMWLRNMPNAADLKQAAEAIKRPEVQREIERLDYADFWSNEEKY
jgi:hypothetical protein